MSSAMTPSLPAFSICDLHSDLPSELIKAKASGEDSFIQKYRLLFKSKNVCAALCALYCNDSIVHSGQAKAYTDKMLELFFEQISHVSEFLFVSDKKTLLQAIASNKTALLLSIEGAECIESPKDLQAYYNKGVRFMGLTHSRPNIYACGASTQRYAYACDYGITRKGKELIKLADQLKLPLDLSHLNDLGASFLLSQYKSLLFMSHSNARVLRPLMRNAPDEQLKAIAQRNGVCGLNGVNYLLSDSGADASCFEAHIKHLISIGNDRFPALGADLFFPPYQTDSVYKAINGRLTEVYDVFSDYNGVAPLNERYKLSDNGLRFIYDALP